MMIGQIESFNGSHARVSRHNNSGCFILHTNPARAFRNSSESTNS